MEEKDGYAGIGLAGRAGEFRGRKEDGVLRSETYGLQKDYRDSHRSSKEDR